MKSTLRIIAAALLLAAAACTHTVPAKVTGKVATGGKTYVPTGK